MVPGARRGIRLAVVACTALLAISLSSSATAHKKRQIGEVRISVGWLEEPPLAGFQNGVQLLATRGGQPVEGGTLRVVVLFGDRDSQVRTEPMPLTPVFGEPGHYLAHLIPTRPGRYTFLITGRLGGKRIDEAITSGEKTFDDVVSPAEAEFPEQDPTPAELAERLDRIDARLREAIRAVEASNATSHSDLLARVLAAGAALASLLALGLAARGGWRRAR